MNDTDTVVDATEALKPCPSTEAVYARGAAEDDFTMQSGHTARSTPTDR
jgi:hypothetical protein